MGQILLYVGVAACFVTLAVLAFGLSTIAFGLAVGTTAGLVAKARGSWV